MIVLKASLLMSLNLYIPITGPLYILKRTSTNLVYILMILNWLLNLVALDGLENSSEDLIKNWNIIFNSMCLL